MASDVPLFVQCTDYIFKRSEYRTNTKKNENLFWLTSYMEQWIFSNKGIAIKCGGSMGILSNNCQLFQTEGIVKLSSLCNICTGFFMHFLKTLVNMLIIAIMKNNVSV
jgi:hypothetical protein